MSIFSLFRHSEPIRIVVDPNIQFDPIFQDAVDEIYRTGNPSIPALQKRFRIGWARAAMILDQMEAVGLVGPDEGPKPRKMLLPKKRWNSIRPQCTNQLPF